ncbi:2Fe-2S ferredoxin-type domain-containing protein OS=Streptomyces antimycoticus OX=68175 GN=SANT12839_087580 PE=4 SV=1 [Streptomyces antimycoticus]
MADVAELDAREVRERMSGNLCRCGAYNGIVEAVLEAAGAEGAQDTATAGSAR